MLFPKEKELWRYASKNLSRNFDGINNLEPQQPHAHQHQHPLLASHHYRNSLQCQSSFCNSTITSSTLTSNLEYSGSSTEVSFEQKANDSVSGCSYGSSCDGMSVASYIRVKAQKNKNPNRSSDHLARLSHRSLQSSLKNLSASTLAMSEVTTVATAATTTAAGTFAATVNMLRNCCGGSGLSTDSRASNSISNAFYQNDKEAIGQQKFQQTFRKLMKMLNWQQQATLLDAVKSRKEMSVVNTSCCILLKKSLIYKEEPYVIVCRLFFWQNLRDATELKRLPSCSNDRHPMYVCCNPLHWYRVLETDTAPPPYQMQGVPRSKFEDEDCTEILCNNNNISTKIGKMTDSEERQSWCQVAYWELNERVGNRYCVQKPFVNIYAEGSSDCKWSQDMCLMELAAKKGTPSREGVENTRQKIGLGLILSQESDGVWLYNRSKAPVFILSPTLNESLTCVYKVAPGDCLKAFDNNRAQSLNCSSQFPGAEAGPINMQSICISFVKGWGEHYKRQDIMKCPCWLEISFSQR
ncbi:mothers against decapentaplegic homolog 7 [Anastrepha obliqua]|uniref:mothers against decapentaplegic homolog 7 n=1 Tax=Anastrepha obliqua TaxID=95512 RepID=UPI002409BF16|nr:mothers against decapentaplegic homolog 7 [Anastrepha obliqua]XP_054745082.1 mothers against decapentaplegic homolog 7 [Anastrepha obliqua]XP_054745091.1 mothers against decapentaplegic homolog 7 [Anastrepha obliqua]XP_054745102.1 mothers against decapentaplegic homolog 7 [Anastrepha obliqua]XP_054745110.1 mothers against decapentaplegic homolog 7 [Anastrepha obliqua]XP_054745119.1 mothers against decapentaplegic homolog 7 [Anastrepha obliqua]